MTTELVCGCQQCALGTEPLRTTAPQRRGPALARHHPELPVVVFPPLHACSGLLLLFWFIVPTGTGFLTSGPLPVQFLLLKYVSLLPPRSFHHCL